MANGDGVETQVVANHQPLVIITKLWLKSHKDPNDYHMQVSMAGTISADMLCAEAEGSNTLNDQIFK